MSPTVEETNVVRTYCLRMKDEPTPIRVRAEKLCVKQDGTLTTYTLLRNGQKVGEFTKDVVGWWIEEAVEPHD